MFWKTLQDGQMIEKGLYTFWMIWNNKRRAKVDVDAALAGLSLKQIQDLDWKHPAFRWRK